MADLLSRVRGKPFYLLILIILFTSSCNDSDDDSIELPEPAANNAPTITSSDTDTATLGSPYAYTLIASDADGDALTFQASILPTWLTFDATSGELSGITPTNASGDYQVTLAASDGIDSTPLFLTISIINSAPTITSTANNNGVVGDAYSYTLTANDVDADTLTFSSITLPSWAMLNDTSGEMTGTPDASGDYEVELSVSDGELSANQRFTLVVTNEPSVVIGFDQAVVFSDFGGAVADIIANPDQSGINTSDQVGRMQKFAGEVFGGSTISLDDPITLAAKLFFGQAMTSASLNGKSFAADNIFTLKVWSQRQVALTFKIEGDVDENDVERVVTHDGTGWEVLSFDFTGVTGTGYTAITLIFDNGVVGDAADDSANWTFYFDDMVIPVATNNDDDDDTDGGNTVGPEILVNGGFEAGFANWKDDVGTIEVDGSNSFFFADVQAAGNPWDVNQSQVITLMPDTDYILSFKAKASVARTIIAGLGQNFPDFIAVTETVALTTEWQTYTYTLTTTGFGGENNRVLFDMGSEIGAVSLDDVSVTLASVDNGGSTVGPEILVNGGFEAGFANWKDDVGTIEVDGSNSFFFADVQAAGNPWDVNQSQVITLMPDTDYILSFKAKASVARTIIAGLGQNFPDFIAVTETVALTTEWQTYTYTLTTTGFGGENNRVLFDMGSEIGAVSLDDVSVTLASVDNGGSTVGPEILVNSGFEAGFANWKDDVGTIEVDGSNSFFFADVQAAGNPWDVNQSQVITLMPDTDYILSFKAKASVARTIIAGLGQNFPDFIAVTETVALTTEWQTYTYTLTTTGFGGENNRVLFDMGSEIGAVSLDDVSVTLASVDNGGDTGGDAGGDADGTELTTNGDLEVGDLSGWTSAVNGGNISADNTQDSGSTWSAHIVAGPGNNPAFSQAGLAVGTVNPGDTIDISFDMCGTAASGGVIFPALLSEFGGDAGADRQTLETIATPPSIWTRYNYSAVAGSNVNGGISLQLDVVCGADAACSADVYFDNVSVTINGGPAAGNASGNSCVATDTGDDTDGDTNGDANGEFTTNGDFESGFGSWNEVGTIEMEGDNSYLFADVQAAGNPWDVNLSQVMTLMPNTDYILSFRAKASVARTMIAGLGQNFPDFIAVTEIVSLTTEWQTYTYTLTTTGFGGANNRVLFDMGAEIGAVSLDDVSVTLVSVNDGGGTGGGDTGGDTVTPLAVELVVFETAALPEWAAWTDGKGPTEVLQDGEYGGVTKFTLTGPTVAGFTSRDGGGAVNGMTFDASNLTNGMITFDFKMVKAPDAGLVDWKLKIESSTGTNAEVNLSSSVEGHATPLLDTWQTYSFPIATLVAKGLDATAIDLFMVFPDYNNATGAEFYLDNFKITSGGAASNDSDGNTTSSMSGGSLIVDVTAGINFEGNEAEQASWDVFENVTNPALEFVTNPYMLGNTSSQSAKITLETAGAGSGKFAGAVTRTVTTFKLSTDTVIAKIWVYKDKISPVGIKFERKRSDGYGSHGELTVSNTKINEWEQLTIDFTSQLGLPENDEISGIAIFPDMVDGRTGTVVYFDEITFTPN